MFYIFQWLTAELTSVTAAAVCTIVSPSKGVIMSGSNLSVGQGHRGSSQWAGGGGAEDSLAMKLHHFLASLTKSRGFYANLAESLCSDESFAETRDTADCWNGQRIGE